MGRALDFLKRAAGQASLLSPLGAWRQYVSGVLDGLPEEDIIFPWIRFDVEPARIAIGPTLGWLFVVNEACYVEFPLHPRLDRTRDIVVGVGWAPAGSEVGQFVRWSIDVGAEQEGSNVTVVDATVAREVAVPPVAADYARTGIMIPAAVFADPDVDELHVKLTRLASSNDPAVPPGLHHVAVIQRLL